MYKIILSCSTALSVIFIGTVVRAQTVPPTARNYDETYKKVCEGPDADQLCDKVSSEVSREIKDTLSNMRPIIQQAARLYKIDPRTVVGAILAEHSMNTGASDIAQDALVSLGLANGGVMDFGFYKKQFTFGFGQLHFERALEAEAIAAEIEKRPKRTDQQVQDALLTPEGAIYYAAALIRQAQDMYKSAGYDLSNDPAVLTTLYNIGKVKERLDRTQSSGRMPEPNYFGLWVLKNLDQIKEVVGDYKPDAAPIQILTDPLASDSLYFTRYTASSDLIPLKSGMTNIGTSDAALSSANTVIKKGEQFSIMSSIDDPTLGTLHLVQAQDGRMGYLPESVVLKKSTSKQYKKNECKAKGNNKCLADMDDFINEKDGETIAQMTPVIKKDTKPKDPREEILDLAERQANDFLNKFTTQAITWSDADAKNTIAAIDKLNSELDPIFKDVNSAFQKKIADLDNKKAALESVPKLEEADMVEILDAVRSYRAKAAKDQPEGTGIYGSGYAVFEPLITFYEACAIEHFGASEKIANYFSENTLMKPTNWGTFDSNNLPLPTLTNSASNYGYSNTQTWISQKLSLQDDGSGNFTPQNLVPAASNPAKKVRPKNSGENCYGDKKQFIDWLNSIPIKPDPNWSDLEPAYKKVVSFYQPISSLKKRDDMIRKIPKEIQRVKDNAKDALKVIEKKYPEMKANLNQTVEMLRAKSKAEAAKLHPYVQAVLSLKKQVTDCKLVTNKDKEITDTLSAIESELNRQVTRYIKYFNQGNNAYLVDYNMQDNINYVLRTLDPHNSYNSAQKAMLVQVPSGVTTNSDVMQSIEPWVRFGKFLSQGCGVFENEAFLAYLNSPDANMPGADKCKLDVQRPEYIDSVKAIQMSLIEMKQKFGTEKERMDFIRDLLKNQQMIYLDRNNRNSATETARFPTYHDLAADLSKRDCVQAIFVSRVQELDLPKTVLMPNGNTDSIRVVWKGSECKN